jgi:hypothetical protein
VLPCCDFIADAGKGGQVRNTWIIRRLQKQLYCLLHALGDGTISHRDPAAADA